MVRPEDTIFDPEYPGLLKLDCITIELTPSHINKEAKDVAMEGCENIDIAKDIVTRTALTHYGGLQQLRGEFPDSADFIQALIPSPVNWETDILFLCLPDDKVIYRRLSAIPWSRNIRRLAVECGQSTIYNLLAKYIAMRSMQMGRLPQESDEQQRARASAIAASVFTAGMKVFQNLSELYLVTTPAHAVRSKAEEVGADESGFVPINIDAALDHTGPEFYNALDQQFIRLLGAYRSSMRFMDRQFTLKAGINVNFILPVDLSRAHPDRY